MRVYLKTFGCRTNIYDSQIMAQYIKDFEIIDNEDDADIVIVNSCTVTNSADSSVRGYINTLNRKNKRVILAGCGAFSKGDELFESGKIFGYFGHSEKKNINSLLKRDDRFKELGNLNEIDDLIVEDFSSKTKAFIKIQEGCDFNCSYCIIPIVRGGARSQDESKILKQIEILANNGYGEFVLSGTNIGSYGKDTNSNLAKLLKKISLIKGVKRVRVGSLEPSQIDDEFFEILDESWLERHLHIALQHTNKQMLKIMRRRNLLESDLALFEKLAQKGFALGTDFIVAHPKESEEIWQDAKNNFKKFPITHLHGFIYSKRDLTHSATMKSDIKGDVAKRRLKELEAIVKKNSVDFRKKHNIPLLVLVESIKNGLYIGYDQFFNQVRIKCQEDITKEWIYLKDYQIKEEFNYAEIG